MFPVSHQQKSITIKKRAGRKELQKQLKFRPAQFSNRPAPSMHSSFIDPLHHRQSFSIISVISTMEKTRHVAVHPPQKKNTTRTTKHFTKLSTTYRTMVTGKPCALFLFFLKKISTPPHPISTFPSSLVPERLDRLQAGGLLCGPEPEKETDQHRKGGGQQH